VWDEHLYGIETHILLEVQVRELCLEALMGKEAGPAYSAALEALPQPAPSPPTAPRLSSYSASCHKKCLRCVKL
jgi:hypothetical protein